MGAIGDIAGKVIDAAVKFIPNEKDRIEYARQVETMGHELQIEQLKAQADIVKAEAASNGWLAQSWRPIVMLTFTALIVARWLGWSAPGLSQEEVLKLWDIVQFGIGGYIVGRSAEKIVPATIAAVAQTVKK